MYRHSPLLIRSIHPTTILFLSFVAVYALLVESGILAPVERAIDTWSLARWVVTLGFYVFLLLLVMLFHRYVGRDGRAMWVDAMSINRGGVALYDFLILVAIVALVYLGWRYLGLFDAELFIIAVIAAVTALIGLLRRPPWGHIYIFQRSSDPLRTLLEPSMGFFQPLLTGEDGDLGRWEQVLQELMGLNPGFNPARQSPGQELYIAPGLLPASTVPEPTEIVEVDPDSRPTP